MKKGLVRQSSPGGSPPALEALESALREYDGALLAVSHDAAFLEAIGVERRVWLEEG